MVGGGVAGIAAAVSLAHRGVPVLLLESRRRLGGRATSFVDAGTGDVLDNCQHVTLGCCDRYLHLCELLGVRDRFEWHREQYWVQPRGDEAAVSVIAPGRLPAPLHYAGAFLKASFLDAREKLAIANAMRELLVAERGQWKQRTFGEFLDAVDQSEGAKRKFWSPVIVSACNAPIERVSASPAIKVFQEAFLASAKACEIGLPTVPLVELYASVEERLRAAGGAVRFGAAAASIAPRGVTLSGGERLEARAVVSALPLERACDVVVEASGRADRRLAMLAKHLAFSPIIGVHLEFERPVLSWPHAVLVDCETQWVFRKDASGRRVHAVISAAADWVESEPERIMQWVEADLARCFPRAMRGNVRRWGRVVKERRATFLATPSFERSRGAVAFERDEVVLAGDYVDTDWPATMEGAAIAGFAAAERVTAVLRGLFG